MRAFALSDRDECRHPTRAVKMQFGGQGWELFWVIQIRDYGPRYDCEITAEGFKPLKFEVWRLFKSPYKSHEDFPRTKLKVDGEEVEVPIYEHTFTLER